jgi:Flp pilus assembly protein TadD
MADDTGRGEVIQAAVYMRNGNFAAALPLLQSAAEREPESTAVLSALGLAHLKLGDSAKAMEFYGRCLELDSENPVTLNLTGMLRHNAGDETGARELLEKAAALNPRSPEPVYNLALVCLAEDKYDDALGFFDRALALSPLHHRALMGKSRVLAGQKRSAEMADCLRAALVTAGAKISFSAGKFDKAAALYSIEAGLHPDNPGVLLNLAAALLGAGKLGDCVKVCEKAVEADPENPTVHIRLATTLLTAGDFKNGWREYEWRLKADYLRAFRLPPGKKQWDGSRMDGGNLLVICEQGCGDAIQFSRYLPMIKERSGASIKLLCRNSLWRLFENSMPGIFEPTEEAPPPSASFDCYISLMSAPFLFGTDTGSVPPAPYLKAPADAAARFEPWLSSLKGKKVGLAWAGNPLHKSDRHRSVSFEALKPLFELKNISFVSLQKSPPPPALEVAGLDNFHDRTAELNDFADTAGLVSGLDLVLGVDTAVSHLSGALGKKTWILIPFVSEWRWMRDTETSPWYSSVRLIRQDKLNDWPSVIKRAAAGLSAL